jgi:hypothetical protein
LKLKLTPAKSIGIDQISGLVHELDADDFAVREKASAALVRLGPSAEPALREAQAKAGAPEVKQRLEQVLQQLEEKHRHLGNALEMLEMIGTPAARSLLNDLANGARDSRLTREAQAALDRLKKRT